MTGSEAAERRRALGYNQSELAALLHTSTPAVSRAESSTGEVRKDLADLLATLEPSQPRAGARGPYKTKSQPAARSSRRVQAPKAARERPPPAPAEAPQGEELPVLTAQEAGAVLLEELLGVVAWAAKVAKGHRQAVLAHEVEVAFAKLLCRPVPPPLPTCHARACWRCGSWRP